MKKHILKVALIFAIPWQLYAIGLGALTVYSHLDQPFNADIHLIDAAPMALSDIKVSIADVEEFAKAGLTRDEMALSLITLSLKRKNGQVYIVLRSTDRMQTPYLELLIDVAWPSGQLYRAYKVLLDPEHYDLDVSKRLSKHGSKPVWMNHVVVDLKPGIGSDESRAESPSTYGPTLVNENIWQIAQRYTEAHLILQQVMLAILGRNPDAFAEGNVNGLKPASRLIIPTPSEMKSIPASLAREEVNNQDSAWQTHTPIQHVLFPPYIQDGELSSMAIKPYSSIPSAPVFETLSIISVLPEIPEFPPVTLEDKLPLFGNKALKEVNSALENRLKALEKQNALLLKQLKSKEAELRNWEHKWQHMEKRLGHEGGSLDSSTQGGGWFWKLLLLLGVILMGYAWYHRRQLLKEGPSAPAESPAAPSEIKQAIALVKSKAALDALLNLAKTYISRQEYAAAKHALEEVMAYGDEAQRSEASRLWEQLR